MLENSVELSMTRLGSKKKLDGAQDSEPVKSRVPSEHTMYDLFQNKTMIF